MIRDSDKEPNRLLLFQVLVLLGLWLVAVGEARAVTPAPYSTYYINYMCQNQTTCGAPPQTSPRFTTIGAACQWADSLSSYTYSHYTFPWGVCCPVYCRANNSDQTIFGHVNQGNQCPAGTTLSGGSCYCDNGGDWDEGTQSCIVPCASHLTRVNGVCTCPINWQIDTGTSCVCVDSKVVINGECVCAPGWSYDESLTECVPKSWGECPDGFVWNVEERVCEADPGHSCDAGYTWTVEFGCMPTERCQVGWTEGGMTPCLPKQPSNCEGGQWGHVNGVDICLPSDDSGCGWLNGKYVCQPWASDEEKRCVVGQNGRTVCLDDIPPDTPSGTIPNPNECPPGCVCDPEHGRMICTQSPDGSSTTTTTRETLPDGRTLETQTRKDGNGAVLGSTVIERDAQGNETQRTTVGLGGTEEGPKSEVTAPMCGEFTCKGDAIQCFLARAAHEARCVQQGPTAEALDGVVSHFGESAKLKQSETDLGQGGPFGEGPLGGPSTASCPAPMSLSVVGLTIPVDYTPICDLAGLVRPLVLSFGALAGIRFMFGG